MNELDLQELNRSVRQLCGQWKMEECRSLICRAMAEYPDAAQPHNLLGIILEKEGNHLAAMKHFRAAWALDPTYMPASQNLNTFGTFHPAGPYAFDETDVSPEPVTAGPFLKKEGAIRQELERQRMAVSSAAEK